MEKSFLYSFFINIQKRNWAFILSFQCTVFLSPFYATQVETMNLGNLAKKKMYLSSFGIWQATQSSMWRELRPAENTGRHHMFWTRRAQASVSPTVQSPTHCGVSPSWMLRQSDLSLGRLKHHQHLNSGVNTNPSGRCLERRTVLTLRGRCSHRHNQGRRKTHVNAVEEQLVSN